ncbi:hypothetical protein LOS73_18725 [Pseudoalteromonas sp. SCSIO 43210]
MNLKKEIYLSFFNRALPPLLMFFSFAYYGRKISSESFELFLLDFSLVMWVVTFLFQSQKNAVIKLCVNKEIITTSFIFFIFSVLVSFLIIAVFKGGVNFFSVWLLTLALGFVYYFGAYLRVTGNTSAFLKADTLSIILRWVFAFFSVFLFESGEFIFLSLAIGIFFVYGFHFLFSNIICDLRVDYISFKKIKIYVNNIVPLVFLDLAIAAYIYCERFMQQSEPKSNFILMSTLSTQSISLICGVIMMVVYPRLSKMHKSNPKEFISYWKKIIKLSPFFILSVLPIVALGPFLMQHFFLVHEVKLLNFILLGLSHSLYFIFILIGTPLIIVGEQVKVAGVLSISFMFYLLFIDETYFLFAKLFIMTLNVLLILFISKSALKKGDYEKN